MRILYVSQYYPPEMGAPAARVSELSRLWARQGHEVIVLTAFPHHPHGVKRPEDRGVITRRENDGDVTLVRTYVWAAANAGFLKRVVSYLSFMLSAMLIGVWRVGRPDVVIATSPQLFTAVAGWWISRVHRVPFVFEVRDLWPESIVTVGAMREGVVIRMLKRLAYWLYRAADRIVTVGPGYRRQIVAHYPVPASKIDVVSNGVDLERYHFREGDRQAVRAAHGWENQTVLMYLGTHGMAHGLEFVLEAADRLRAREDLRFVFVGDGAEKSKLMAQAQARGLQQVTFLPPKSKDEVVRLYAASDICIVPLRKLDLFRDVLPSKLFEIMAMERPILLSVDGDARDEVERAKAGVFVEPENVEALCGAVLALAAQPERRQRMGRQGRRHVEQFFSREALADRYAAILHDVVGGTKPAIQPAFRTGLATTAGSAVAVASGIPKSAA